METNELMKIWQTLSNENLIDKSLAKDNIERIIQLKSCKTIEKLSQKLRSDYLMNMSTAALVLGIMVFVIIFTNQRNISLPIQGYVFLILVISYYALKAVSIKAKLKLLDLSHNTSPMLDSLKKIKTSFEKVSTKESLVIYGTLAGLTVFANILINDLTQLSKFSMNSLQGYVLIFSIGYLLSLPFIGKYYFNKRFSGIITDLNHSIEELNSAK